MLIRGEKVILDSDLAALYGVTTKRLNEQIGRNRNRFPGNYLFRPTRKEVTTLRLHFATSNGAHGGLRYIPFAFTEHGAIMAASVLNTPRAVERKSPDLPAPHDKRRKGVAGAKKRHCLELIAGSSVVERDESDWRLTAVASDCKICFEEFI